MLTYINGDIFSSPAQVLVNTVNTMGVMGKGLALEFKNRYPEMFVQYKKQCDNHKLSIGRLMLWYGPDYWIMQFPTKEHWRKPSKIEYIEKGLQTFVKKYADYNIASIAFPKLGCGNGNLKWEDVKPLMERYLKDLPIDVYVYLSNNKRDIPEHENQIKMSNYLKSKAKDLSYLGVFDEIMRNSSIIPISLNCDGKEWDCSVISDEEIKFASRDDEIIIDGKSLHELWDDITYKKIFICDNEKIPKLLCGLLSTMGFIKPVQIQYENNLLEGYQLEAGKGRLFLVRGYDDL